MIHELYIIQIEKNIYGSMSYRNRLSNKLHRNAVKTKSELLYIRDGNSFEFNDGSIATIVSKDICCGHVCGLCSICYHSFWCSCYEYSIKSLICMHVHYIAYSQTNPEFKILKEK